MNINTRAVSILLVDDDEINNFISIKLIRKALFNAEITACLNGKFAIDQLVEMQRKGADKLPDYILLDINMPVMDGYQALVILKKTYPDMRFLVLSQLDHEYVIIRMVRPGYTSSLHQYLATILTRRGHTLW